MFRAGSAVIRGYLRPMLTYPTQNPPRTFPERETTSFHPLIYAKIGLDSHETRLRPAWPMWSH
jgi:hypothetical protein